MLVTEKIIIDIKQCWDFEINIGSRQIVKLPDSSSFGIIVDFWEILRILNLESVLHQS